MKIYNYKEGKAFFENDTKMLISEEEYKLLFQGKGYDGHERYSLAYYFVESKIEKPKMVAAALSEVLAYVRQHDVKMVEKEYSEFDIRITFIYVNGELVYMNNGEGVITEKGDDIWEQMLAEVKNVDKEVVC